MSAAENSAQQHAAQGPRFARVVDVSSDLLDPIKAHLAACAQPFRPSMLYDAGQERKFQDPARRLSEFRAIVEICEALGWSLDVDSDDEEFVGDRRRSSVGDRRRSSIDKNGKQGGQ